MRPLLRSSIPGRAARITFQVPVRFTSSTRFQSSMIHRIARARALDARGGYHCVNRPELLFDQSRQARDRLRIGHVQLYVQIRPVHRREIAGRHGESAGRQTLHDRRTQATGGAGHDRHGLGHRGRPYPGGSPG